MIKEFSIDPKYAGKYVALKSKNEQNVVSCNVDPKKAFDEARQKGIEKPVILFVPQSDSIYIY